MNGEMTYEEQVMAYFGRMTSYLYNDLGTCSGIYREWWGHEFEWSGLSFELRYTSSIHAPMVSIEVKTIVEDDVNPRCEEGSVRIESKDTPKSLAAKVKEELESLEKMVWQ